MSGVSRWKPEANTLEDPLHWSKARHIEVMSDLFHELVADEFIDKVFAVMALCPQHTFQVLTKRPERMVEYLTAPVSGAWAGRMHRVLDDGRTVDATDAWRRVSSAVCDTFRVVPARQLNLAAEIQEPYGDGFMPRWPLPNVWLGTSVENQKAADERIPHLLRTAAAVRFLSCEPLLGPVDLLKHYPSVHSPSFSTIALSSTLLGGQRVQLVDWVICGGESGSGFREMDLDWARGLRQQCVKTGVPFFFKQSSGLRPEKNPYLDGETWRQFPGEEDEK